MLIILSAAQENKIATKTALVTLVVNIVLALFKLIAGIIGHSGAMISDAVHSASDVFSTLIVMVGIKLSKKDADEEHQYGHERIECLAAVLLAALLALTALGIAFSGLSAILNKTYLTMTLPTKIALIAAVISIIVKEWMYWYTRYAAKLIDSGALLADAWHHRSDALSSLGSLIGISGAMLGFPICDPLASLIICVLILKASYDIAKNAIVQLIDTAADEEIVELIEQTILQDQDVIKIDDLKTRAHGSKLYVDVTIAVDGNLTVKEAHHIAEKVHAHIKKHVPQVKHCMVHIHAA